jgi:hypothetical protein
VQSKFLPEMLYREWTNLPRQRALLLEDENGQPVEGKKITFRLGEQSFAGITDTSGSASASFLLDLPAGSAVLSTSYQGSEGYEPAALELLVEVRPEDARVIFDVANHTISPQRNELSDQKKHVRQPEPGKGKQSVA